MKLHDTLSDLEIETEEQADKRDGWMRVISRMIFGKVLYGKPRYPLVLLPAKDNDE